MAKNFVSGYRFRLRSRTRQRLANEPNLNLASILFMNSSAINLAALFQSGAVLQRDQPLTIWGWGPPSQRVRVSMAGQIANGWISTAGAFRVVLPPLPAGGPHILRVELPRDSGTSSLEIPDIHIGEVWLASGQSNMQWTLGQCGERTAQAIADSGDPLRRFFTVGQRAELAPQRDVEGSWKPASPETSSEFSAVAYFFARRLRKELDVPVGVIVSAWGGTPIEAWMPRSAHAGSDLLRSKLRNYEKRAYSDERWDSFDPTQGPIFPADPGLCEEAMEWKASDYCDDDWAEMQVPSTWQRHGHGHSGVFWFRQTVRLPDSWIGRELLLELGAADKHDITYVNGVEVGRTGEAFEQQHWNQSRFYRIPAEVVANSELKLAVRVYSFAYEGGLLGPAEKMRVSCPDVAPTEEISLAGTWKYRLEHDLGYVATGEDPGHLSPHSPGILYENMIAPLARFALRGVLWYQGESNTAHAADYPKHLRAMITSWRNAWEQGDFPFLLVQLPGFGLVSKFALESSWALFRQGQLELVQTMTGTGLAVTIDCGEAEDIHPTNKEPVGERLAQWALADTYGKACCRSGPLVREAIRHADGSVLVAFDGVNGGLTTSDGDAVGGVFLMDANGHPYSAEVLIEGDCLRVRAEACKQAVMVYYAWADFPLEANLVDCAGFPASPFRCAVEDLKP